MTAHVLPMTNKPADRDIRISDWEHFVRSYTAHPVAALFPMLPRDELEDLGYDIAANGLASPIVLDDDMRVVDGRNRLAAMALDLGVDMPAPRFVRFSAVAPSKCPGPAEYIISTNITRRHLDPGQRATIVAEAQAHFREDANKSRSEKSMGNKSAAKNGRGETSTTVSEPSSAPHRAWERVAATAGVSEHAARQALSVVADAPDLAQHVAAGDMKLSEAAKEVKARKAMTSATKPASARKKKPLPLAKAKTRVSNAIADALGKVADEDWQPLRDWIANGCKP